MFGWLTTQRLQLRRPFLFASLAGAVLLLFAACRPVPGKPALPSTVGQPAGDRVVTPQSLPIRVTPAPATPSAAVKGTAVATATAYLVVQPQADVPARAGQPTLADFWAGRARFVIDVPDSGLPMGESDTIVMGNGELWSYLHASQQSAGAVDQCGAAVPFPGCVVIYRSLDGGVTFEHGDPLVCQVACRQCPCDAEVDHMVQQQYPRVFFDGSRLWMVYEYLGRVMLRWSRDGLAWSDPEHVADSVVWHLWYRDCPAEERIGEHPFVPLDYECLRGGPPGLFVEDGLLYVFVAQGQNPGAMGCFKRDVEAVGRPFVACDHNPLVVGAAEYGPLDERGPDANPYFDFRTISSAEIVKVGEGPATQYYMLYEGVRGPGPGDAGDTQFGLGLARTLESRIDGPWEKSPRNPLLVDLPGNVGVGHADLVIYNGRTYLYTSLDGTTRTRLVLAWAS